MKKWFHEDWRFRLEAVQVGQKNKAEECRIGIETGDVFECTYGTPDGFCPTSFLKIFPSMEAIRCNGDLRNLGGSGSSDTEFICPDGVVKFRLIGERNKPS